MLHDADEAEDVVQETFVRLYRAMPRYEERQRFESWLFQILGNCCRTANTASQRRVARTLSDDELLARVPAEESALAALPEHNREIFLLHYVEGLSYEEIETMTGVGQSALKMRVKRASDALRARLSPEER